MNIYISHYPHRHKTLLVLLMAVLAMALPARVSALDLSTYAEKSRLAEGNWVKISVDASGVYLLTNTQLRQMGFSDPSKVKIFGYGARR